MALTTTPEVLRELARLHTRIAELERTHGLRPGEGAPGAARREDPDVRGGLHEVVASLSDDLVAVVTTAGEVVAINAVCERAIGLRPEEVVGKNAWSFVHPEDVAAMASARSAPLDDGIPIEVRVRCADGSHRWLELTARQWPREEPRFVVLRYRDAGYRAARGEPALTPVPGARPVSSLQEQLRRAAALARVSQLALGLPATQDVLDAASALAGAGLGVEVGAYLEPRDGGLRVRSEAGLGEGARQLTVPVVMTVAGLAWAGGEPMMTSRLTRDPRLSDALLSGAGVEAALAVPVRGAERAHGVLLVGGRQPRRFEEEEVHFLGTVANVVATSVDGRAARQALESRERLLRAVFERANDGMLVVDDAGRAVEANPAAERMLGASVGLLHGRRPGEGGVTLDLSAAARALHPGGEVTVGTPTGPRTVEYEAVPGIMPGRALVVLRDVTERREMQARLAMADRLIAVGTLAAGVAHELNTPLAYVASNLEYVGAALPALAAAGVPMDEVRDAVMESLEGTERLRLIIEDLRAFARAPSDEAGPADLEAVLRSCVSMTWNEIRHRAVLERDLGTLPPVVGNPARLAQVFVNLLVNAVHAIPPGARQANRIRLSARASGDVVTVEVEDSGAGIPAAVMPRVFDPFFTTKPAGQGTGLGLPISRSILARLGGQVELESQPGRGTLARVRLPVAVRPAASAPPAPAPQAPRGRVLVVDDERLVGSSLRRLLGGDHEVTVVGSSRMALRRVEQGERFDAIIADVMMPDLTGVELQQELARLAPGMARRFVFVTAGAFGDDVRALLEGTGAPLLHKPASRDDLRRALARVMLAGS